MDFNYDYGRITYTEYGTLCNYIWRNFKKDLSALNKKTIQNNIGPHDQIRMKKS